MPDFQPRVAPLPPAKPIDVAAVFAAQGIHLDAPTAKNMQTYDDLLLKWQKAINLVGPGTMDERGLRHFIDSAQLMRYLPSTDVTLVDIGSGAGFPGMVLALMGVRDVHLVESDIRKATFLREVSRETQAPVTLHDRRVESTEVPGMQVMTARALAPLVDLLGYMYRMGNGSEQTLGLFLKGAQADAEVVKAQKKWEFTLETFPSMTDAEAKILKIQHLKPKKGK